MFECILDKIIFKRPLFHKNLDVLATRDDCSLSRGGVDVGSNKFHCINEVINGSFLL